MAVVAVGRIVAATTARVEAGIAEAASTIDARNDGVGVRLGTPFPSISCHIIYITSYVLSYVSFV